MNDDLNTKNTINLVNPLNPNQILKTIELINTNIEQIQKETITEENKEKPIIEEPEKKQKKKSGSKKFLPIIIVLVLAIIGIVVFLLTRTGYEEPPTTGVNPTLNNILTTLDDDVEFNKYTTSNDIEGNKLLINITLEDNIYNYEYRLEEASSEKLFLTTTVNDEFGFNMLLLVIDAIAQINNIAEGKTYEYLKSINFNTDNIEGILIDGNKYKIDITKTFDKVISYNYYSADELKVYRDFIVNSGNVNISKGDLIIYKLNNNEEHIVITIGQKDDLNELTYNTILSLVEVINSNDLSKFKENYTTLETKTYEQYAVVIDPVFNDNLNNLLDDYKTTHKFVQLIIQKS